MVDMTAEHPVNEILAIRRYHEIYTIPYTDTQWHGSTQMCNGFLGCGE